MTGADTTWHARRARERSVQRPGRSGTLTEFDAIVVGTGFAGAVTACRLVEAGFRVCVLERGRRYGPEDFPTYPTDELFANVDRSPQQLRAAAGFLAVAVEPGSRHLRRA